MSPGGGRKRPRVAVLGTGFAGIGAARPLKVADVDVFLVDKHDFPMFQPLLCQGSLHLALLSTDEDRSKAVVDWTWEDFPHERPGRTTVATEEVE